MIRKAMLLLVVLAFVAAPALADPMRPEFEAVGDDSANVFNDAIRMMVVNNVRDGNGNAINEYSNFGNEYFRYDDESYGLPFYPDPCFPNYDSVKSPAGQIHTYSWRIVLQTDPVSDIDLKIRNCVLADCRARLVR